MSFHESRSKAHPNTAGMCVVLCVCGGLSCGAGGVIFMVVGAVMGRVAPSPLFLFSVLDTIGYCFQSLNINTNPMVIFFFLNYFLINMNNI